MERGMETKWHLITVMLIFTTASETKSESSTTSKDVMNEFIHISGMRMGEYNFWLTTEFIEDCATYCLDEDRIDCRSFSYSVSAGGCGTYEKSRADALPGMYGKPVNPVAEDGVTPSWGYYERKSKEYKALEEKMQQLQNLTEISVDEATELLSGFGDTLRTENETEGSGSGVTVSPGELDLMSRILKIVVDLNPVVNASVEISESFAKTMLNFSDSMMDPSHTQSWLALQRDSASNGIAGIVTSSEVVSRDVSERLLNYDNSTSIVAETSNIGLWMDIVQFPKTQRKESLLLAKLNFSMLDFDKEDNEPSEMYIFPTIEKVNMTGTSDTTDSVLSGDVIMLPTKALRNRSVVTHVRYKGLTDVIPPRDINLKNPPNGTTFSMKSSVLTTSVHPRPPNYIFESEPVVIIFTHYPDNDTEEHDVTTSPDNYENVSSPPVEVTSQPDTIETTTHCVFWDEGDGEEAGGWSSEGCELELSNETHTICKCKHLTSFAVLLKMVDTSVEDESYWIHNQALSFISYIGCAMSLGGVVIMCGAFIMLKFHTENMKIHFNLGVAVGAADLVFIFEELAQQHQYSCVMVTVLLYYFNMAVLSWMLIEGLFLYSQVVVVFVSARRWVKYYVLAGWGIPAIIMGISMGILNVQLGNNKICWLSPADNSIWAFAAPAILVIVINFVILISVVRVIVSIQPDQTNNVRISKVKNAVKGSIFLSPLLGTTWLFGFLSLSRDTLLFQYVFATTNSLQGFFLFVFHCLCNSEVRADFARRQNRKPSTSSGNGGKPPWYSGTFGLNVASGLRKFRDSISFEFASSSHSEEKSDEAKGTPKAPAKALPVIEDSNEADDETVNNEVNRENEMVAVKKSKIPKMRRSKTSKSMPVRSKPRKLKKRQKTDVGDIDVTEGSDGIITHKSEENKEESPNTKNELNCEDVSLSCPVDKKLELPALPSMPMKNDMILPVRANRIAPMPSPIQDKKLTENDAEEAEEKIVPKKENDPPIPPAAEATDQLEDETEKEAYKIPMSYDSGLNSIDNESLLEEEYNDEYVEMPYGRYRVGVNGCDFVM